MSAAAPRLALAAAFPLCLTPSVAATAAAGDAPPPAVVALDNGTIRVGVDPDRGGAITYLAKSGGGGGAENVVNRFDLGREIQMSFYSGPVPFAPNGKQPAKAWAGLGWNPIQSGDCFGNRSRVVALRSDGKELYVKCVPLQWPLENEPGECTFETWIRLEGTAARVRCRLVNHRADTTQYPARDQELPAVYANGPYHRLMTYAGEAPFTGGALSQIPQVPPGSSFPWSRWQATENWAALVNDVGEGVGVWEPGVVRFLGGFAGKPGAGGPADAPTGYVAPLQREVLDHDITYEYQYVLILGSVDAIRGYVYAHAAKPAPPEYRFAADRQHWTYANATDTGWPIRGELAVRVDRANPQLIGPDGFWQAGEAPKLYLDAAFPKGGGGRAAVYWKRADAPAFGPERSLPFDVIPDGEYHAYAVDLSASPEYRGAITGLRLDPPSAPAPDAFLRVRSVSFGQPAAPPSSGSVIVKPS